MLKMLGIIHFTATTLNWIFNQLIATGHMVLKTNHSVVSIILYLLSTIHNFFISFLKNTAFVFENYSLDFLAFLQEIGFLVITIANCIFTFTCTVLTIIQDFVCGIIHFVLEVYSELISGVNTLIDGLNFLHNGIYYCIYLIFTAVLILLQSVPNGFILIFYGLLSLIYGIYYSVLYIAQTIVNIFINFRYNCYNAILSIPVKAYFGLVLLLILYHLQKPIIRKLRSLFCTCAVFAILSYIKSIEFLFFLSVKLPRMLFAKIKSYFQNEPHVQNDINRTNGESCSMSLRTLIQRAKSLNWSSENGIDIPDIQRLQKRLREEEGKHLCIICQDESRNIILLPCRHFCLCQGCYEVIQSPYAECPVCRQAIVHAINVFT